MQNFGALGALPADPRASGGWGLSPYAPQTAPPIANFWLRAWIRATQKKVNRYCNTRNKRIIYAAMLDFTSICETQRSSLSVCKFLSAEASDFSFLRLIMKHGSCEAI